MAKAYYTAEGSEIHLTCYPYPTGSTAVYEVAPSNAHDTKWRSPETWDTILWEKDSERADDGEPRSSQDTEEIASSPKKPLSFWLAFLSLSIISLVVAMDATSLAVAVPSIARQLQGTTLQSFWASISFMLAVVVMQPIYTSVSDVLGRKIPLYAAIVLFAVGSVVFATAQSMVVVILGRVLQGLGGGGLDVLQEIIVADITSLKERPLYLGLLAIPMAIGTILGPIAGALFSQFVSWRWIGWVNLPAMGVASSLTFFLRLKPIDQSFRAKLARLDWLGIILFAAGSVCVSLPLSWAGEAYPWSSWITITPLTTGVAVLVVFGFYETSPVEPVFPRRIFANRTAIFTLIGAFLHGLVMYSCLSYIPLFFQAVFLEAPLQSAISMLPVCICVVVFSGISAFGVEYTRRYNLIIWLGWMFTAYGLGVWSSVDGTSPPAAKILVQMIAGVGLGTVFTTLTIPMQASVASADDAGLAVGILVGFRLFGALIGLAVGSTSFSSVFAKSSSALEPLLLDQLPVLKSTGGAIAFIPELRTLNLPADQMADLIGAYRKPFMTIWIIMASVSAAGFLSSLFVKELTLENEDLGKQRFEPP